MLKTRFTQIYPARPQRLPPLLHPSPSRCMAVRPAGVHDLHVLRVSMERASVARRCSPFEPCLKGPAGMSTQVHLTCRGITPSRLLLCNRSAVDRSLANSLSRSVRMLRMVRLVRIANGHWNPYPCCEFRVQGHTGVWSWQSCRTLRMPVLSTLLVLT